MAEQEIGISPTPRNPGDKKKDTPEVQSPNRINLAEEAKKATTPEQLVDLVISHSLDDILPWEKVQLPSLGLFYDGKIPDGEVQVRPMSIVSDKIFATQRLAQSGQAIDHVFKNCVKFPTEFDPLDLLVGDRMFLLYYLRGITHGNAYEFSVKCSNTDCQKMFESSYDLNKLQSTIQAPKCDREPVRIPLPYFSEKLGKPVWVEARFLRGSDLQIIIKNMKNREVMRGNQARTANESRKPSFLKNEREEVAIDQSIEENLNLVITSVNGLTDRLKIKQFIDRLTAKDTATIRETLREVTPGMDTQIIITCPHCQTELKTDIPITETFFRPTIERGA